MAWRYQPSKFKNTTPKIPKKEDTVFDLPIGNLSCTNNGIQSSANHLAFCIEGEGGKLGVVPVGAKGRRLRKDMTIVCAHGEQVDDFSFMPFEDDLLLTCSRDEKIKLWRIGAECENSVLEAEVDLGSGCLIGSLMPHSTASNIVAYTSTDQAFVVDWEKQQTAYVLEGIVDKGLSCAWSEDGRLLAANCDKGRMGLIWDVRAGSSPVHTLDLHTGMGREARVIFAGDKLVSSGFTNKRVQEVRLYENGKWDTPLHSEEFTATTGLLIPLYDADTKLLFFAGKGTNKLNMAELQTRSPVMSRVFELTFPEQLLGACLGSKRRVNVMEGEVQTFYQLTKSSILPLPCIVPRRSYRDFHSDLFPDTRGSTAGCSASEWRSGKDTMPGKISLAPGSSGQPSAEVVVVPVQTPITRPATVSFAVEKKPVEVIKPIAEVKPTQKQTERDQSPSTELHNKVTNVDDKISQMEQRMVEMTEGNDNYRGQMNKQLTIIHNAIGILLQRQSPLNMENDLMSECTQSHRESVSSASLSSSPQIASICPSVPQFTVDDDTVTIGTSATWQIPSGSTVSTKPRVSVSTVTLDMAHSTPLEPIVKGGDGVSLTASEVYGIEGLDSATIGDSYDNGRMFGGNTPLDRDDPLSPDTDSLRTMPTMSFTSRDTMLMNGRGRSAVSRRASLSAIPPKVIHQLGIPPIPKRSTSIDGVYPSNSGLSMTSLNGQEEEAEEEQWMHDDYEDDGEKENIGDGVTKKVDDAEPKSVVRIRGEGGVPEKRPMSTANRIRPKSCVVGQIASKFRHVEVLAGIKANNAVFSNLRNVNTRLPPEANGVCVSSKWAAIPLAGPAGIVCLLNIDEPCKLADGVMDGIFNKAQITDLQWNPFDENELACGTDIGVINMWKLSEEDGMRNEMEPVKSIKLGGEKIVSLRWHPLAADLMAVALSDASVELWNVREGTRAMHIQAHDQAILGMAWSADGKRLVTVGKDLMLRVFSPQMGENCLLCEAKCLESPRSARVVFACDDRIIIVVGFTKSSTRQVQLYDAFTLKSVYNHIMDNAVQPLVPHYDFDTSVLFLTGKGDRTVFMYEVCYDSPYLLPLSPFTAPAGHQAVTFHNKTRCNVMAVEFQRAWRLTEKTFEQLIFRVPRVKKDIFQSDLFPDALVTWQPSSTAIDWLNGVDTSPHFVTLRPDGVGATNLVENGSNTRVGRLSNVQSCDGSGSSGSSTVTSPEQPSAPKREEEKKGESVEKMEVAPSEPVPVAPVSNGLSSINRDAIPEITYSDMSAKIPQEEKEVAKEVEASWSNQIVVSNELEQDGMEGVAEEEWIDEQ